MNADRWQRVADIYEAAVDLDGPARAAFLADACADDVTLHQEVESLLAQQEVMSPLDKPVWVADNLLVEPASLAVGASLGPYRIEALLGAGGMGHVYRAKDTKLGRSVALKVLPDPFARDPERRTRFQREAQILAVLNHPHIGAIHGFEDSGTVHALVLELVEGPTLADRLAGGPLSLDEAIAIARQIVDALDAAHDQGIVHRDLKPANVKVRADGTVKVLDFGLARLMQTDGGAAGDAITSPTTVSPVTMTGAGTILGTAAYMSPEQAMGRPADARSDVWAFGCVLFEMLTGRRPFAGDSVAETLAAVLRAEPDWSALPSHTPDAIRRLLQRCLQKDRRRRLAAIADARMDLDDSPSPPERLKASAGRTVGLIAGSAVVALVVVASVVLFRARDVPRSVGALRFTIAPPDGAWFGGPFGGGTGNAAQVAIAPDGQTIAFVAGANGQFQIWLRSLASLTAAPLIGTEGGAFPFWSPDGRAIGFFAADKLKVVQIAGGPPVVLSDVTLGRGGTWNRDNVILFAGAVGGVRRVSSAGGTPTDVTTPTAGGAHRWPHFLPDGRHFFYTAVTGACCPAPQPGVIRLGSLDSNEAPVTLLQAESLALYASGHLFFARDDTLMAQPFNAETRTLNGEAVRFADHVSWEGSRYVSASASETGTLVYGQGSVPTMLQMTWFDRSGSIVSRLGDPGYYDSVSLSPDQQTVAVSLPSGIWLFDVATGSRSQLTRNPRRDTSAVWSPDGKSLAIEAQRNGRVSLRRLSIDGSVDEALIDDGPNRSSAPGSIGGYLTPTSWSNDGRFIAFARRGASGSPDVWALPLFGDRKAFAVVDTPFAETSGVFSRDGHWIAYTTDESGASRVMVQPFPGPGRRYPVSPDSGHHPLWRADGKELFYISENPGHSGMLMAVPIEMTSQLEVGMPQPLFGIGAPGSSRGQNYAVTKDGRRFLTNERPPQKPSETPLTVVVNWMAALRDQPR